MGKDVDVERVASLEHTIFVLAGLAKYSVNTPNAAFQVYLRSGD